MSDREVFFPNDNPIIEFEARRANDAFYPDPDGSPSQPSEVELRIYNGTDGTFVEFPNEETVATLSSSSEFVTMQPAEEDTGARIFIRFPATMMSTTGNYTAYITCVYEDNNRITTDQKIQISEYR